ncbi:hypothetical protein PRIPAC_89540 [Pristionchus pacificus]|uniref:Uncharacterized protein n=1 Tax=Pristionchus pacificus TaxID=54126 RepID=A0A2A6CVR0_PRIPA|nr:hypothetical protein PRIPAC_89540 [Pristionchus pacificus]|eukprot:PDM82166.1 hypothetical protein PRIPAC_36559 [Pristionchus pacificus]
MFLNFRPQIMDVAITVAVVYILLCAVGLVLNILTIRAIVVHGMLKKAYSNMYILYLQPLITDILFQLLYMGYVAPAIIVQTRRNGPPQNGFLQSPKNSVNLDWTASTGCSYHSHGELRIPVLLAKLQSSEQSRRRRQELRFASQFAILAVIYTLSWVLFTLLPVSAVSSSNWAFGLPAVISLINSSANAIVFIINDRKRLCFVCKPTTSTQGGSSVQNSNKNSLKNKTTENSSMNQSTYFNSEIVVVSIEASKDKESIKESRNNVMEQEEEDTPSAPRLRRGSARKSYANMDLDDDKKKDKTVFCSINRKRSVSRKPEIQEEPKRVRLDTDDPLIVNVEKDKDRMEEEDVCDDEDRESQEDVPTTTMTKSLEETDAAEEEKNYRAWVAALKDETLTEYAQRQFDEAQLKLRCALSKVQKTKDIVTLRQNDEKMVSDVLAMCGDHLKLTEAMMEEMRPLETFDECDDEDENPVSLAAKRVQEGKSAHESAEKKVKYARGFLLVAKTNEEWSREHVERANTNVEVWRAKLEEYMNLDQVMDAERKIIDEEIDRVKNVIEVEMEKDRKKREDEEKERKRKEDEEMKNMEDLEIEMKKKEEEVEQIRKMIETKKMEKMDEEEKKKLEEEKERKEEEMKKKNEEEMKKRIEEEVRRRVEEELKVRVEEEIKKRMEEEKNMRKEEEEKVRKEEEEKMSKEEEEKMRNEEEERNRKDEEENKKKEEEERNRNAQEFQRIFREGEMKKKSDEDKLLKEEEEKKAQEEKERIAQEFKRIMEAGNEQEKKRNEDEKRREEENKMEREERERIEEQFNKFKEKQIKKRRDEKKKARMEETINSVAHNKENQPPPPKKQRRSNRKIAVESANSPAQEPQDDEITIEYEDVATILDDVITLD